MKAARGGTEGARACVEGKQESRLEIVLFTAQGITLAAQEWWRKRKEGTIKKEK